jgi:hypothetical protein
LLGEEHLLSCQYAVRVAPPAHEFLELDGDCCSDPRPRPRLVVALELLQRARRGPVECVVCEQGGVAAGAEAAVVDVLGKGFGWAA